MAGDRVGLAITVARWFKGCVPLCTKSGVRGLWVAANVSEKSQSTSRDGVHGISSGVDPVSPTISQRRSTWRSRGSDDEALASAVTASMPKRLNSASRSASSARNAITSACSARATTASCRACSFSSNLKFSESSADADASPAARSTPSSKALEWPHGLWPRSITSSKVSRRLVTSGEPSSPPNQEFTRHRATHELLEEGGLSTNGAAS
mmetsp:Transcript_88009/g.247339  ORF Transcript_88009/g.247339 Transcript_88009/m.247339 type:complete len:209 (+) Transcript_88009:672-1298(+)